jgi:4-diphosphocytidyl-2-C-methyl-D-erythritol kinase
LSIDPNILVTTRPPAKLNFFLELLRRREDGYHDIDTVMAAIDWCDRLSVRRTREPKIQLHCDWSPSRASMATRLGLQDSVAPLLDVPTGETNLVYRALDQFSQRFSIEGGFECWLEKQIPAGAGMGGASSNAASALMCAATLCSQSSLIYEIASEIGSDVPFFLGAMNSKAMNSNATGSHATGSHSTGQNTSGDPGRPTCFAARAQGRGTEITPVSIGFRPHLVAAFPGVSLSTAKVYAECEVPDSPTGAEGFLNAWKQGNQRAFQSRKMNRLAEPARKLSPQIDEMMDSMWRSGARTCQLTGSGSACFAIVGSAREAQSMAKRLQAKKRFDLRHGIGTHTPANAMGGSHVLARATTIRSVPAPLQVRRI